MDKLIIKKKTKEQVCHDFDQFLPLNPFGAIGDYSRPLVDRCCRLWST